MNIIKTIIVSILVSSAVVYGFYNYFPISAIDNIKEQGFLGATITTIAGTDTLKASRAVINTNFANLNSDKIETSSTTLPNITTLENLVTVGTITTGGWSGTEISVSKGGTGSSTLAFGQVLLGSTTNAIGIVDGHGTATQVLTSQGSGQPPYWANASADVSLTYDWTNLHTFSLLDVTAIATTTLLRFPDSPYYLGLSASTTDTGTQDFTLPTTDGSSGDALVTTGSGHLYFDNPSLTWLDVGQFEQSTSTYSRFAKSDEIHVTDTSYIKAAEFDIQNATGTIMFVTSGREFDSGDDCYSKIYKNGVAYGVEHTFTSATIAHRYEKVLLAKGDLVQLYSKRENLAGCYVRGELWGNVVPNVSIKY